MTICYFTATGNCLYVAKRIGGNLLSIPHLIKTGELDLEDDAVGIVCPVYAAEMPGMVRQFLEKAHIRTDYFFFVYTYGMGYGEAFAHAELAAKDAGVKLSYVNAVQMVDNYLPGFEMGRQIETLPQKNVEGQIDTVCQEIAERKQTSVSVTPAVRAKMAMYQTMLAKPILKKDTARKYLVNDRCIRCGICAKVCPADNITVGEQVVFSNRCEVCYACLHNCPHNAIHLKSEKSAVRFRNEHIGLNEIIAANE